MKIVMHSVDYLPNIGGVAAHIYHLASALHQLGHELIVLNPVPSSHSVDRAEIETVNGFQVYRVPYDANGARATRTYRRIRASHLAFASLPESFGAPDIIHQHDGVPSSLPVQHASRIRNVPWIWTNHTSGFLKSFEKPIARAVTRFAFAAANGVIAVSREINDKSQALWPEKPVSLIPNGVDLDLFHPGVQPAALSGTNHNTFTVLCPRRITPKNGVLDFAKAIPLVVDAAPNIDWKFVFVGGSLAKATQPEYFERIYAITRLYERNVLFLDDVPMNQMPELNSAADLVVMPSLMEAISLSALEAMATAKPVIATNVGGLPEIIRHESTGLLVEPRRPDELAVAILRVQRNHDFRDLIRQNGHHLATSEYSWRQVAERTVRFYQSVECQSRGIR